jgi:tetratricopeptide (TPR) repeat protein
MSNTRLMAIIFSAFFLGACVYAQVPSTAPALYREGANLLQNEKIYDAITAFKQASNLNPRYFEPLVALAESYYYLDEYDEALRWIERAKPFGRDNSRLLNIQGRLLLALGKPDDAAKMFREILRREPYNIDALLGMAEFSLAKGDELSALAQYQKTLEYNRRDKRILLSLALMYEEQGKRNLSEEYIVRALESYPESPMVQTMTAEYYLRRNRFQEAIYHAMTANTLAGNSVRALQVLARTHLGRNSPSDALVVLDTLINLDSRSSANWYLRGQALLSLKRSADAVEAFSRALTLDASDEITRLVLENVLLENYPESDELRQKAGQYHFEQAAQYLKKNLYGRAAFHFTRGTLLAPLYVAGRLARAEYYRTMGQHSLFLRELEVLAGPLKVQSNYVKDNLEIYRSLLSRTVAAQWKIDQYTIDRDPLIFRVFYGIEGHDLDHGQSEYYLADYLQSLLATSDKVSFKHRSDEFMQYRPRPSSQTVALRMAREERADYYLLSYFKEDGGDFHAHVDLYLARTGNLIRTYKSFRTGNFRVQNAIFQIVEDIHRDMPLRGRLLDRKVNDGLINLGSGDGLKEGDVLHMVSPDAYILQGESPGFEFSAEKKTGIFTVTRIDQKVAQGTIKREGFFDRTNTGDILLRNNESVLKPKDPTSNFPFLYNRIREIR